MMSQELVYRVGVFGLEILPIHRLGNSSRYHSMDIEVESGIDTNGRKGLNLEKAFSFPFFKNL